MSIDEDLVKTKMMIEVGVLNAPKKTMKMKLQLLPSENEVCGTLKFDTTPMKTPCHNCPCAPKPIRHKLLIKLCHIRRLTFSDEEE